MQPACVRQAIPLRKDHIRNFRVSICRTENFLALLIPDDFFLSALRTFGPVLHGTSANCRYDIKLYIESIGILSDRGNSKNPIRRVINICPTNWDTHLNNDCTTFSFCRLTTCVAKSVLCHRTKHNLLERMDKMMKFNTARLRLHY
jgi:hypothetical protein